MARRVVVAGAGPAGIMAASKAALRLPDVIILEKNTQPCKKLLITGKGRCNITNASDINELIANIPCNGNFLYSSFNRFSSADIMEFFTEKGLPVVIERGNRVFPASGGSVKVAEALVRYALSNGVAIKYNARISHVGLSADMVTGVILDNGERLECDSVVIATGGMSYPATGSTGDGYRIARECGHTVVGPHPSLVPLVIREAWVKELQGLTLKNISAGFYDNKNKLIYNDFGELLFTHFGVSGPIILSASCHVFDSGYSGAYIKIDLKPALDIARLDSRVQRDFSEYSRKQFKNSLDKLLPRKLIPVIVRLSGIPEDKPVNSITRDERLKLVTLVKNMKLTIEGTRPIEEAIVTSGGVSTREINPATMESRLVKGLYFAGEVMDVDGYTGGFNLTIAFSTGYTAGCFC